ncbi:ubiquitin fusion degradation protein [Capsaspora owczarzaki ATCC 30864]|uniref:ubiquitin fusion degradation protein n=1 Tax=Capsaspora owczarzaki (strain ATCC 30864) TaxID=595528 RepID=UPI0003522586|nr:ubiquitin fusion degradation protein [Capsaspora owczarzaki ATCC 30864]|eukprot:XP_004364836.2 ubiquitin fusion degradation protein [Capsaspora owczarzaki ATCC 30864]
MQQSPATPPAVLFDFYCALKPGGSVAPSPATTPAPATSTTAIGYSASNPGFGLLGLPPPSFPLQPAPVYTPGVDPLQGRLLLTATHGYFRLASDKVASERHQFAFADVRSIVAPDAFIPIIVVDTARKQFVFSNFFHRNVTLDALLSLWNNNNTSGSGGAPPKPSKSPEPVIVASEPQPLRPVNNMPPASSPIQPPKAEASATTPASNSHAPASPVTSSPSSLKRRKPDVRVVIGSASNSPSAPATSTPSAPASLGALSDAETERAALTASIMSTWFTPQETTEQRTLPDGTVVAVSIKTVRRALTNVPCLGCRNVAARKKCASQLCATCCWAADSLCKVHFTPKWKAHLAELERVRLQQLRVQRGPCRHFMAGHCRNGVNCLYDHGSNEYLSSPSIGRHLIESTSGAGSLRVVLRVVSAASVGKLGMELGDKINLPASVLMFAVQRELTYPMAFEMTKHVAEPAPPSSTTANSSTTAATTNTDEPATATTTSTTTPTTTTTATPPPPANVHGGVLDFTTDEGTAILPSWMMKHIGAETGDQVVFRYAKLPKGEFVKLQPVSTTWLAVPFEQRRSVLEYHLRNYQTLTEGMTVSIEHHQSQHDFKVLECKPARAISIIDTDIVTDVVEPLEDLRFGHTQLVCDATPVTGSVKKGESLYYLFHPKSVIPTALSGSDASIARIVLRVHPISGDPDLYVSQAVLRPQQAMYTWCAQEPGDKLLVLESSSNPSDCANGSAPASGRTDENSTPVALNVNTPLPFNGKDPVYIAVHAALSDVVFTLSLLSKVPEDRQGHRLTTASETLPLTVSAAGGNIAIVEAKPGQQACSNCGKCFAPTTLVMHERNCVKQTYRCPIDTCKQTMPISMKTKHALVAHTVLRCMCGFEATQRVLHEHQHTDCRLRMVECTNHWCRLLVSYGDLALHTASCSARTTNCPACHESVMWSALDYHFEAFHCLPSGILNWELPLVPQLEALNVEIKPPRRGRGSSQSANENGDEDDENGDETTDDTSEVDHADSSNRNRHVCECGADFRMLDDFQVHQLTDCSLAQH